MAWRPIEAWDKERTAGQARALPENDGPAGAYALRFAARPRGFLPCFKRRGHPVFDDCCACALA